jgi:hypothetical protein
MKEQKDCPCISLFDYPTPDPNGLGGGGWNVCAKKVFETKGGGDSAVSPAQNQSINTDYRNDCYEGKG